MGVHRLLLPSQGVLFGGGNEDYTEYVEMLQNRIDNKARQPLKVCVGQGPTRVLGTEPWMGFHIRHQLYGSITLAFRLL